MRILIATSVLLFGATPLLAQDAAAPADPNAPPKSDLVAAAESIQPPGSSDDLNNAIATARPRPAGILKNGPVSLFDPIFDEMNANLDKSIGLKFGLSYTTAYQNASDTPSDHEHHAAGDVDLYAKWRMIGEEKSPTRGILGVYSEYRHNFAHNPVPKDIGDEVGTLWRTTNGFGRQKVALTQAWWEQHLADDKVVLTFGKMDPDNHYNKNRYQSDSTTFLSQAFSANPARKHASNGLGANLLVKVAPEWYVTGGLQDANGDKLKSGFHTIDEGDFFGAAEVGWTPSAEGAKGAYRLTVWKIEAASIAGIAEDHGISLSCDQEICKSYVPFFRAGWSEGDATGVELFACGGIGLEGVVFGPKDLTGIGFAWGDPKISAYRDQFSAEIFHRFQVSPDVQFTVGYQYYFEPATTPSSNDDPVGVFELRLRVDF